VAYIPQDGCVSELLDPQHIENFWYDGRQNILRASFAAIFKRYYPQVATYMDYGAGTGEFGEWVKQHLNTAQIMAADSSPEMLRAASARGISTTSVPLGETVCNLDFVTMFDVLEHIGDDVKFLSDLHHKMRSGGFLMISVPAHPWLFGAHDIRVGHYRRYSRAGIIRSCAMIQHPPKSLASLKPIEEDKACLL
jgi:2-polyprenyl-3-methyl-5-hydroxy-6-metoxy-1,4-benzoquinol methylase